MTMTWVFIAGMVAEFAVFRIASDHVSASEWRQLQIPPIHNAAPPSTAELDR